MEVNTTRFPSGIPALADWLHGKGEAPLLLCSATSMHSDDIPDSCSGTLGAPSAPDCAESCNIKAPQNASLSVRPAMQACAQCAEQGCDAY